MPILEGAIAGFCMLAFACSSIVMLSLVNAHHAEATPCIRDGQKRFVTGALSRTAIVISILTTSLSAVLFVILHVHLN